MILRLIGAMVAALATAPAQADGCEDLRVEGASYTVCRMSPDADLRLFYTAPDGRPFGTFGRIEQVLAEQGERLGVAMNAGMYHRDLSPVGLYIEDGREVMRIITSDGPGNFGLLPNGVFCVLRSGEARVIEARRFEADPPDCRYATQSGPMLVIDDELHPRFLRDSDSRYVRNGVGVTEDGEVIVAISNQPVNFHAFARLFRDELGVPNALYLDGNVSRLYAPGRSRRDAGRPMGPILGAVLPAPIDAAGTGR